MSGILQALLAGFGAVTDEYFKYVTMLLPGNGTNGAQNNTFLDSSTNNFTITRNGNTTQGTFAPYGSNWSNYFDGSGDYLQLADSTAWDLTGDYTIEMWLFKTASASQTFFQLGTSSNILLYQNASNQIIFYSGAAIITASVTASLNTWNHVALVRSGSGSNNTVLYLNGVNVGQATNTTSFTGDASNGVRIGSEYPTGFEFNGYISNVRVVKGTAVYTSAFTPSAAPLTAITNTSLLTCQSNRFIDNSTNAFTITVNGDTSVQRFSPFNPTAPYAAGTDGGSGYFDGTGDYLNTPTTGQFAPAGDFTIAVWYYPTTLSTNNIVIANYTADLTTDWQINVTSTGSIEFYTNGNPIRISGGSVKAGAWNYIVLARSGSTLTGYLNGTSIGTYTQSGTFGSATKTIWVGSRPFSGSPLPITGYISDVKLIDGSAVTTVPTAPQTATTGTNLLLSFTNGGIIDNAMMNDLETVGNAQISTSVSKFGGGSLAFDGTGDYLSAADSPNFYFGSGDWTIEAWLYINTAKNYNGYFGKRQAGQFGLTLQIDSGGTLSISASTTGSSWALAGASLGSGYSTGAWMHVAVTRSGTTITGWRNGTSTGTQTLSGSIFPATGYIATIGSANDSSQEFNGYIDDLRITKGYARYTANFTAPTAPFPLS